MRRAALALILAAVCALGLPGAASAGASCSQHVEHAPSLGSGITTSFTGACSVMWGHSTQELQYESGGTWHDMTQDGAPVAPTMDGAYLAGAQASGSTLHTGIDQTPYCAYNLRATATFFGWADKGDPLATVTSPVLAKSC